MAFVLCIIYDNGNENSLLCHEDHRDRFPLKSSNRLNGKLLNNSLTLYWKT
jgi:hypothetical protein